MSRSVLIVHEKKILSTSINALIENINISDAKINITTCTLLDCKYKSAKAFSLLVFIFPILGNNDLLPENETAIKKTIQHFNPIGSNILLILQGDRHCSDELVKAELPIAIKLSNIFKLYNSVRLESTKLDLFTSNKLAKVIQYELSNSPKSNVKSLDGLTSILEAKPKWDYENKVLDFYDYSTGHSLIYRTTLSELNRIGKFVRDLEPETLNIANGYMHSVTFLELGTLKTVLRANLSSNFLLISDVINVIPKCEELNLSANNLKKLDLTKELCRMTSVMLYKNSLNSIDFSSSEVINIRRFSVYRNNLSYFDWPNGGMEIEYLNLGANPIEELPESLHQARKLKFLGLARTKIKKIPEWIFELHELKEIDISYIEDIIPKAQLDKLSSKGIRLINKPN